MNNTRNNEITSTTINIAHEDNGDYEINIHLWLAILSEAKWLILLTTLLGVGVSLSLHYILPPKFEVDAMMYASSEMLTVPGLEEIPGMAVDSSPVLTEAQILLAKQTIGEVVRKLHLNYYAKPHYFPLIGNGFARHFDSENGELAEPLFGLSTFAWGGERIQLEQFDVPDKWLNLPLQLLVLDQDRYHLLDGDQNILLEIRKGERSSKDGFTLLVSDLHARVGTSFDIMLMSEAAAIEEWQDLLEVLEEMRGSNIITIICNTDKPDRAVMVINQLLQIHIQNNIEFSAAQAEKRVKFIMLQLPELLKKLNVAQRELNDYLLAHKTVNASLESTSLLNKIMEQEQEISALEIQRLDLLQMFTPGNIKIQAVNDKIKYMKAEKNKMQQKVKSMPQKTQQIEALERSVQTASDLYISLLNRAQTLRIAQASDVGTLRIVDTAKVPDKSSSLGMAIMAVLGAIAGLLLGLTGVLWRILINDDIENPDDIEKLGISILASIPHSQKQEKIHLALKSNPNLALNQHFLVLQAGDDRVVESMRSLRTNLYFSLSDDSTIKKRVMISSSGPDVGKSFISVNLAQLFQQAGKKVLIVDADMRRGHISKYYNTPNTPGLSDVLSEAVDVQEAIFSSVENMADILPAGTRPNNPSELLMQPRFAELLDQLDTKYDLILIDTPPVLAVTDAIIIGAHAHENIVVLRSGMHNPREIRQLMQRFSQAGLHISGAVFNDIPANAMSGAGAYGYPYQYGSSAKA